MDKEIKDSFAEIEKRIKILKTFPSLAVTVIGTAFIALAVFAGITLQGEKTHLRDLERQLVEKINIMMGRVEKEPFVAIFTGKYEPLEKKTILVEYKKLANNRAEIGFPIFINNIGERIGDPLYLKIYSRRPIKFLRGWGITDEKDFETEDKMFPNQFTNDGVYPVGFSVSGKIVHNIEDFEPKEGTYPMLIKVFSGAKNPFRANFYIKFKK